MTREMARRRRAAALSMARRAFRNASSETSEAMREWFENCAFNSLEKARRFKAMEKAAA